MAWHPRYPSLHRARAVVALLHHASLDDQWHRFLRAPVRNRSVVETGPDDVAGIPECGVDRAAIFIARVPRRTELDALQQPATTRLFHHRVHSRAYVHPDGVH